MSRLQHLDLTTERLPGLSLRGLLSIAIWVTVGLYPLAGRVVADDLPLPKWTEEDLRAFQEAQNMGAESPGILLPGPDENLTPSGFSLSNPSRTGPKLDDLPSTLQPDLPQGLSAEHFHRFLPDLPELQKNVPTPTQIMHVATAPALLKAPTPEFIAAASQALAKEYLIDPEQLIPEVQSEEMLRFLDFHGRESRIKLYVLMLPSDRHIPGVSDLEKICSGALMRSDSCLLAYPMGEPWRARLFVSKTVHDQASGAFLSEAAQACLKDALTSSDPLDQLQQYCTELSTRLFWLQRGLLATERRDGADAPLREFGTQPSPFAAAQTTSASNTGIHLTGWMYALLLLAALPSVAALIIWGRRKLRHYLSNREQNHIWVLPEVEPRVRLGGAFTGGGGIIIPL